MGHAVIVSVATSGKTSQGPNLWTMGGVLGWLADADGRLAMLAADGTEISNSGVADW